MNTVEDIPRFECKGKMVRDSKIEDKGDWIHEDALHQFIIGRIKELKHQWKDLKELTEHNMGIEGDMEKCRQLDAKIEELIRLGNITEEDLK